MKSTLSPEATSFATPRRARLVGGLLLGAALLIGGSALAQESGSSTPKADASGETGKTAAKTAAKTGGKAPANMSPEDVARRVQAFYRQTRDYQANFTQTYTDIAAGETKVSQGKVYFKKPGMMRWDYWKEKPTNPDKLYVSDGKLFWVYEYDFQQVFKQCLAGSQLPTSLSFLMGQGELLADFDVTFAKGSTEKAPKLELKPKQPTSKYDHLVFELDPATFQVEASTLFDPYGNTNAIDFEKALINKNLPKSGFQFEVPKSARLINPQKECP